jgi:hypothetical protein
LRAGGQAVEVQPVGAAAISVAAAPSRASLGRILVGAVIGGLIATIAALAIALASPPLPPADIARGDAHQILITSWPQASCDGRCSVAVVGRAAPGDWRVRLTSPQWVRCYVVTLKQFSWTFERGVTGAVLVPCRRP